MARATAVKSIQSQVDSGSTIEAELRSALAICEDEKQARILQRWIGLEETDSPTLDAVGQTEGITRERVRQIMRLGQERLRELRLRFPRVEDAIGLAEFLEVEHPLQLQELPTGRFLMQPEALARSNRPKGAAPPAVGHRPQARGDLPHARARPPLLRCRSPGGRRGHPQDDRRRAPGKIPPVPAAREGAEYTVVGTPLPAPEIARVTRGSGAPQSADARRGRGLSADGSPARIFCELNEELLDDAVLAIPSDLREAMGKGEMSLCHEGVALGRLELRGGRIRGLRPALERAAAGGGNFLLVRFDLESRRADAEISSRMPELPGSGRRREGQR